VDAGTLGTCSAGGAAEGSVRSERESKRKSRGDL
jgi:hypothetical protein